MKEKFLKKKNLNLKKKYIKSLKENKKKENTTKIK
jgi:hypothetical protein